MMMSYVMGRVVVVGAGNTIGSNLAETRGSAGTRFATARGAAAASGASTATVGNAPAAVCHLGVVTVDDDVGAARNGVTIEEKPGVFDGCVRF